MRMSNLLKSNIYFTFLMVIAITAVSYFNHKTATGIKDYLGNEVIISEQRFKVEMIEVQKDYNKQISLLKAGISQDNKRRWTILGIQKAIKKSNKKLDHKVSLQYAEWILNESSKHPNVDHMLLTSLIAQESRFINKAKSHAKAKGLGQLTKIAAEFVCSQMNIPYSEEIYFNPEANIKISAWFLSWCINYAGGDVELGLAYYNGGQRQLWRYKYYVMEKNGEKITKEQKVLASKLAEETKKYVPRIIGLYKDFNKAAQKVFLSGDKNENG